MSAISRGIFSLGFSASKKYDVLVGFLTRGGQTPVERYQGCLCDMTNCQKIAIAKRFRRG